MTTNNLKDIDISLSKYCNEIFYIILHNKFISRKYILDGCIHDTFKSIFTEYTRDKWLNSGIKTMKLTKNTRKILNKIYRENELKKCLNHYKNISLILYEFNNSLFVLLSNNDMNIRKKIHLKNKQKVEEFKEIFSELNICSL